MSTRGFYSFALNGELKTMYVQFDAYPGGLGESLLAWLRDADNTAVVDQVRALTVVTEDTVLPDGIERKARDIDTGNPQSVLDFGYTGDNNDFPLDSLWAEWGYVIDFDTHVFEVYEGFQDHPHKTGRFATAGKAEVSQYWPVKLVRTFPLDSLPESLTNVDGVLIPASDALSAAVGAHLRGGDA